MATSKWVERSRAAFVHGAGSGLNRKVNQGVPPNRRNYRVGLNELLDLHSIKEYGVHCAVVGSLALWESGLNFGYPLEASILEHIKVCVEIRVILVLVVGAGCYDKIAVNSNLFDFFAALSAKSIL